MSLSLRQARIFEAVARHGSYTRAAEELHLTQPAVFTQVKQLEDGVGFVLLERVGRRVQLTAVGHEVLASCRELLAALDGLDTRLAALQGLQRGRLRLAMVTTAKYLIPRLLGEFCVRYPGIEAALVVSNREQLLARIVERIDDLSILGTPPEGMELAAIPIADNPLVVIARADHPLAGARQIPLARIAEEPFIVREEGSGTRLALYRHFASFGLTPRVRMELGSNEAIKQVIAGGLGISVLSRHTLALDGDGAPLVVLDVAGFPLLRSWYVVYPQDRPLSPAAAAFIEHLRQHQGFLANQGENAAIKSKTLGVQ